MSSNIIKAFEQVDNHYLDNGKDENKNMIEELTERYENKSLEKLQEESISLEIRLKKLSNDITLSTTVILALSIALFTFFQFFIDKIGNMAPQSIKNVVFFTVMFIVVFFLIRTNRQLDRKSYYEILGIIINNKINELESKDLTMQDVSNEIGEQLNINDIFETETNN